MQRDPWHDSCPECPELMCRLSKLELLAQICSLGLNPDATRPVGRFMSRLSRPYDKTFNTQTFGANVQFGSKSGCSATLARLMSTLSRSYVQTFPTRTLGASLQFGSKSGCGATLGGFLSRLFRPYDKTFNTQTLGANVQFGSRSGCSATLARLMSTLSRSYVQTFPTRTLGASLQFCLNLDAARPLADFCLDFSDLMTRLSGLKLSARLCNLGLNPEAARPLARFLSRLFRPYDKTFKVETLGATLQFGSKSECGATLGTILVQAVQNLYADFPDSKSRRDCAIWVLIRMRGDAWRDSCPDSPDRVTKLSRLKLLERICNGSKSGCSATLGTTLVQTFQTLCPDFPDSNCWRESSIWDQIRMRRNPWHDSCPDFPDLMSRLSRLKLLARICNLGLNPDAARPVGRFMSRLFRPYDKTFKVETLGATLQFGSKSECGATLGTILVQTVQNLYTDSPDLVTKLSRLKLLERICNGSKSGCSATLGTTLVQTFQTLCPDFPDSNCWRESSIWDQIRMRRNPWHDSCPDFPDLMSRLSRLKLLARICNLGLNPDAARPVG